MSVDTNKDAVNPLERLQVLFGHAQTIRQALVEFDGDHPLGILLFHTVQMRAIVEASEHLDLRQWGVGVVDPDGGKVQLHPAASRGTGGSQQTPPLAS